MTKLLDKAIAAGQIFSPATENAHDLYYQLKNSGASEEKLRGRSHHPQLPGVVPGPARESRAKSQEREPISARQ